MAILPIIALTACLHYRNKGACAYTINRGNHVYVECYRAGFIGNLTTEYLTDSVNFRMYLGYFDDEQGYIFCRINGDTIVTEKLVHGVAKGLKFNELSVVESNVYSLERLKKQRNL